MFHSTITHIKKEVGENFGKSLSDACIIKRREVCTGRKHKTNEKPDGTMEEMKSDQESFSLGGEFQQIYGLPHLLAE